MRIEVNVMTGVITEHEDDLPIVETPVEATVEETPAPAEGA